MLTYNESKCFGTGRSEVGDDHGVGKQGYMAWVLVTTNERSLSGHDSRKSRIMTSKNEILLHLAVQAKLAMLDIRYRANRFVHDRESGKKKTMLTFAKSPPSYHDTE
jgi:hypothetical protein